MNQEEHKAAMAYASPAACHKRALQKLEANEPRRLENHGKRINLALQIQRAQSLGQSTEKLERKFHALGIS